MTCAGAWQLIEPVSLCLSSALHRLPPPAMVMGMLHLLLLTLMAQK